MGYCDISVLIIFLYTELMYKKHSAGFTLVELLVSATIVGILVTLGAINVRGSIIRGRNLDRKAVVKDTANALEQYFADNNKYPAGVNDNAQAVGNSYLNSYLTESLPLYVSPDVYGNGSDFVVQIDAAGSNFCVIGELEEVPNAGYNCTEPTTDGACVFDTTAEANRYCVQSRQ